MKHAAAILLLVLLQSCGMLLDTRTAAERKSDRKCACAQRWMAKSVFLCPNLLQTGDSAAVNFNLVLAGDTFSGNTVWADTMGDMDLYCEELMAQNEELQLTILLLDSARMHDNDMAVRLAEARVNNTRAAMQRSIDAISKKARHFEPVDVDNDLFHLTIEPGAKGPIWNVEVKKRTAEGTAKAPCPPQVSTTAPDVVDLRTGKGLNQWLLTLCIVVALGNIALFMLWRNAVARIAQTPPARAHHQRT